ncbi:uncharacterized protein LOC141801127 [Halichoeres trimaculatus]|uniref:uncharacterized protein LOC141801127 n=1 Tax=Halichoeres trimaculatus TaxID=147232 RepID=UPI003D9EB994
MSLVACLLWTLLGGSLGGPVLLSGWPEGFNKVQTGHDGTAYHHLPMFLHARGPVVARELFLPGPHKRPLPAGITALLLPQTTPQQSVMLSGTRAVEVLCGHDQISVRVDRLQLSAWTVPSLFSLGSCRVSKVSPRYLYFHYRLAECGGETQVVGGQLVYSITLCYTPPPQGLVIRVVPLTLPIHCYYNRFHYSYKVGFRPQVQHKTFLKSIRSKLSFSLTVCNAQWEPLPSGHWFPLGEPVHFVAQARSLLVGERLYVDSCYATSSKDPNSQPRVDVITNYGCMTDSRRQGSSTRFLSAGGAVLKFSVDAFLLRTVSHVLYLHCSMSVSFTPSESSKSCNFNSAAGRWEELEAPPSVCSCCDSTCTDTQGAVKSTVSSQGLIIGQKAEEKPRIRAFSFQAEEGKEWEDQTEEEKKTDERMEEALKKVRTFPPELEVIRDVVHEKPLPERIEWGSSPVVSQQGEEEDEKEEIEESLRGSSEKSEQTRKEENEKFVTKNPPDSVKNSSVDASREGSGNTTVTTENSSFSFGTTQSPGSAGNISTAVTLCPDGGNTSCSNSSAAVSAVSTSKDRDSSDLSRSGSGLGSSVEENPLGSELDTLAGSDNKSVDTTSERVPEPAGAVGSEGPHVDDETLQGLQIRGLEPDPHSPRRLFDSGSDSGRGEGETLPLGQFTEGAETSGGELAGPRSVSSELMHQGSLGHSSVVTVTESRHDSESRHQFDRGWVEDWGLQSLGFITEMDHFY